jgi:RHS repeat-associated protein
VQRVAYDEFGREVDNTNPGFQPLGYAGGSTDQQTGLIRFGVRDYDRVAGRWTARDPVGFHGGTPSLYGYVGGDPINRVDPHGTGINLVSGLVGAAASGLGNIIGQLLTAPARCFSLGDALIATGTGFVAGFLAPQTAVTRAGAMLLGGTANVVQYVTTQVVSGERLSGGDLALSLAAGAVGGALGGRFPGRPDQFDAGAWGIRELEERLGVEGAAAGLNQAAQRAAVVAGSNLSRNVLGTVAANLTGGTEANCGCR